MVKKHECVVVAESREAALELTALAAELCDKVAVIAVGDRSAAVNADSAYYIDTKGGSFISAVGSILKAAGEIAPDMALLECTKNAPDRREPLLSRTNKAWPSIRGATLTSWERPHALGGMPTHPRQLTYALRCRILCGESSPQFPAPSAVHFGKI